MKKPVTTIISIAPEFEPYIKKSLKDCHVSYIHNTACNIQEIPKDTEILGTFVDARLDAAFIKKLKKLKMIATFSTGYDHIDMRTTKRRNIIVSNVPSYGENTVAEHAMALILALSRKIVPSVKRVKEGVYDYHGLRGFDLRGKTIGIIGAGRIGMHLIEMLQGFEMTVLVYDKKKTGEWPRDDRFQQVSKEYLLRNADIVSLHVPLFPETHHMINKRAIQKMKDGVYIINTARGGLIDPAALVWGLETGKVAGAGLDTLEQEAFFKTPKKILEKPSVADIKRSLMENIIIDHPHTIVTPHNAFNSTEAVKRIIDTSIENIQGFLGGKPQNVV